MLNLHCFAVVADDKDFFLLMYSQFCCKIRQFLLKKFITLIKHRQNLIKFLMKEIYTPFYSIEDTQFISLLFVRLTCCAVGVTSNITLIDAKTFLCLTYRTIQGRPEHVGRTHPLELNIRLYGGHPHNVCRRRPQDVGRGHPMALYIGQYGDVLRKLHWDVLWTSYFNVLRTLVEDVLRTSAKDVPQRQIEDHMGTSSGRPRDIILPRWV